MEAFIILTAIGGENFSERKECELIENSIYETISQMKKCVREFFSCEVSIYPITDFMDAFNDEEIEQSEWFMSYVFVK